jgi:hypothetical protein
MAVWYAFDRAFDFPVKRGVEVAYLAGMVLLIPETHADAADAAGVGRRTKRPETRHAHKRRRNG